MQPSRISTSTFSSLARSGPALRAGLVTALIALGAGLAQADNGGCECNQISVYPNNTSSTTSNDSSTSTTSTDNTATPTPTPTPTPVDNSSNNNASTSNTDNNTSTVTPVNTSPQPTTNTNNDPQPTTSTNTSPQPNTSNDEPQVSNNQPQNNNNNVQPNNNQQNNNDNQVVVVVVQPTPEPDHKQDMANAGLSIAQSQGLQVISTIQGTLNDINGRLFNLRAGGGEVIVGSLQEAQSGSSTSIDQGVVLGQGDGPEDPIAKRVHRAYRWQVYTTVNYANINQSQINTQAGVRSTSWTPGLGIERHLTPNIAIGFAGSLIETHQTYANSLGKLDMQGVALSTYASYVRGPFWTDLLYSFGRLDLDATRNPGFGLPNATGTTTAYTNTVQFNTGWNFRFQNSTLVTGPFIGVDYMHAAVDGYTESGGGIGAIAYGRRNYDSLISRVGWSVSKTIDTGAVRITPQLRVAFERQNISNNNGTSVNLINQNFSATGTSYAPGQEYMMAGGGVNFQFSDRFNMLLTYQGQFFRQSQQAHYGGVRLSWKF